MFNEVYDQLYKKNPDYLARKVNVAVPDPLHNKVTITESGEQDVVNYAIADIDIEGSGAGNVELRNPKLTINVTAQSNMHIFERLGLLNDNIVTGTEAYLYLKNNEFMSYPYDELPEDGVVYFSDEERNKTVTCYVANYNGDYLWSLGDTILFNFQNATFSNMVNCSENDYTVTITDPSKDASFDILLELYED